MGWSSLWFHPFLKKKISKAVCKATEDRHQKVSESTLWKSSADQSVPGGWEQIRGALGRWGTDWEGRVGFLRGGKYSVSRWGACYTGTNIYQHTELQL